MALLEGYNSWNAVQDEICNESIKKEFLVSSSLMDSIGLTDKPKHEEEQLSIAEILLLDYKKLTELKILKYQTYVISQLKKYVTQCKNESKNFDIHLHQNKLEWLMETSDYLSKLRKQKEVRIDKKHNKKHCDGTSIQRNSYEFCNDFKCSYSKMSRCPKKHFVYNYVKCDIGELINYLISSEKQDILEISITINTINYVFNHMHDELASNLNYAKLMA